jgi:hypothetical protein
MIRLISACIVLAAVVALHGRARSDDARPEPEPRTMTAKDLQAKLMTAVNLPKGVDANTPLHLALEVLSDQKGVEFLIDTKAFADQGNADVENQPVHLPRIDRIRMSTVLRQLLNQVNATFLVRSDHIEIIPVQARPENWPGNQEAGGRPVLPLVYAEIEARPLQDALRDISEATDVSVVIDARVAEKEAKTAVTAALKNVPLDTAVRLLADMAGLKAVLVDNVLYVTTRANARQMEVERQRRLGGEAPPAAGQ